MAYWAEHGMYGTLSHVGESKAVVYSVRIFVECIVLFTAVLARQNPQAKRLFWEEENTRPENTRPVNARPVNARQLQAGPAPQER